MSAKSNLLFVAGELLTAEKALRISRAQGGIYMLAMTAPGREWTVPIGGLGTYGSKSWTLRVQTPRMTYIGFRFYASPNGAGSHLYSIREDGSTVANRRVISAAGDYAHLHKLTKGLQSDSPVDPLTMELLLEAQTNTLQVRDLQIFGTDTPDLPMRVRSFQVYSEPLTTS